MKYYICATATDSDGTDLYIFNGTEKEMMERVRAIALDFIKNVDCDYESFCCGWDHYGFPSYEAVVQYGDYHFVVSAREEKYVNKKVKVSRKSLYKAKKINDSDFFEKDEDEEEED